MSAGRQIDGAEVAFNRLIQEIGGVMPAVIAATVVPRRSLAPVVDTTLAPTTVRAA